MQRIILVAALAAVPSSAFAANILYCVDDALGTDQMQVALDASSHDVTTDVDFSICDADIASGTWDLVIVAIQNNEATIPSFEEYIDGGGAAIFQDYSGTYLMEAFGVTAATTNEVAMSVSSSDLRTALSSSSITLTDEYWITYSVSVTPERGTTTLATFPSGSAITLNSGRNLIYNGFLTDTINYADGPKLYTNEINFLLGGGDVDDDDDGFTGSEGDCDDDDATVHPGAAEICNFKDDDCDDSTDEGVTETFYEDNDGDGFGDPSLDVEGCSATAGLATNDLDCDDGDEDVNPDADEVCNGEDDNCNEDIDDDPVDGSVVFLDDDGDGFGDPGEETTACGELDGYIDNDDDCDDSDDDVNPDADEEANEKDDDCDGKADESVDSDDDGLDDYDEREEYGTDPENADSDGDGIEDGDEIDDGTDPNDAEDPGTDDTGTTNKGLCGCTSTSSSSAAWLGLAALGLVIRARRRSS